VPALTFVVVGVLLLIGLGVAAWVLVPAFRGREAAMAAVGSHRLALGSIITVLVLSTLALLPFRSDLRLDSGLTTRTFLISAVATDVPMLLVVYVRLVMPGVLSWRDLGLRTLPAEYVLRYGLSAGLIGVVGLEIVGTLLSQFGLRSNQIEQFQFVFREGWPAFAAVLLVAAVIAPCVEELFFRGFLFGTYRRAKPLWVAYLASSLLFTALHLLSGSMNLAQMAALSVGIFILALMLAWLYDHTQSLFPGMLAHALNNATGLILFYAIGLR
jgi:membrane protease YdiL (CAAX protease family)